MVAGHESDTQSGGPVGPHGRQGNRPVVVRWVVGDDAGAAVRLAAERISAGVHLGLAANGVAAVALSGGSAAPVLVAALLDLVPASSWPAIDVFQVDERVAPPGHADRNVEYFEPLRRAGATVAEMPVNDDDLEAAAARYATLLPTTLDVVHLGVGDDGHTASWPPAPHPDVDAPVRSGAVAVVRNFNGRDRLTLTVAPIAAARSRVVLATGAGKAEMVAAAFDVGDDHPSHAQLASVPARRLCTRHTTVVVDRAALP